MGNYNSYIYNSEEPIPQTMDISDTESEDTLVINKSYSDSTLEIMTENQREKIVKAVGELDVNNKKLENAISCIYLRDKMRDGFEKKISELNNELIDTQNEVEQLHFINTRLRHKYNKDILTKNQEIKKIREQLGIMNLKYESLLSKKNE